MSTFKDRINDMLSSAKADEVFTLILDDCKNSNVSDIPSFENLKTLSIVNSGLSSLANFPVQQNLKKLDLSDNKISDGLENLKVCKNIKQLLLSGNKIKSVEQLSVLGEFEKLEILELISCDINNIDNYREKVFDLLPKLLYLDGENKNGEEYEDSEFDESEEEEEEEEGDELSMADLLKADHSNDFLDDEEPYVPNENDANEDSDESDLSEGDIEPAVDTVLSPAGVSGSKRCPKRKSTTADNGDVESPMKKIN